MYVAAFTVRVSIVRKIISFRQKGILFISHLKIEVITFIIKLKCHFDGEGNTLGISVKNK